MPVTYKFAEVKQSDYTRGRLSDVSHILSKEDQTNLLTRSSDEQYFQTKNDHGVMGAILDAYSQHTPLTLRPDDVWLAICVAFGKYITHNSEAMRKFFVDFEGRKEIKISSPDLVYKDLTSAEIWRTRYVNLVVTQIQSMCNPELTKWFTPQFTTSTQTDQFISQLILMGSVKEYFAYGWQLGCGFSQITLEGEKEDWTEMVSKVKYLESFNIPALTEWSLLLTDVLTHFVNMFTNSVYEDFWQRAITRERRGSGGQSKYKGWFLVFAPFCSKGKYLLRPRADILKDHIYGSINDDSIENCIIDVPVKVVDESGVEHSIKIFAGSWMMSWTDTLRPISSFIMVEKPFITLQAFDQMVQDQAASYHKRLGEYNYGKKEAPKYVPSSYVKFTYLLAEKYLIPQDYLPGLARVLVRWLGTGDYRGNKYYENPNKHIYKTFVNEMLLDRFVLSSNSSDPDPTKFFVQSKLDEYIDQVMKQIE